MGIPEVWRIYDTFRPLLSNLSQTEGNRNKLSVFIFLLKIDSVEYVVSLHFEGTIGK